MRQFVDRAISRSPDKVSIEEIVYLDEDLHTYKYFMTGDYDGEARARDIAAGLAARARAAESDEGSNPNGSHDPNDTSGAFYHKLVALNDKIGVF